MKSQIEFRSDASPAEMIKKLVELGSKVTGTKSGKTRLKLSPEAMAYLKSMLPEPRQGISWRS